MKTPSSLTFDRAGNLYFSDMHNGRIRKVSTLGVISTVAGSGVDGLSGDGGPATAAKIWPWYGAEVAVDAAGNLFLADSYNDRIRKVDPSGTITSVGAGQVDFPTGVALDGAGNLFVASASEHKVRRMTPAGVWSTVAGNGSNGYGGEGGPATSAELALLGFGMGGDVAVDQNGTLFIGGFQRIWKVDGVATPATFPDPPPPTTSTSTPSTSTTSTSTTSTTSTTTTVPSTTTTTAPPTTTTRPPPGPATLRAPYSVWTQASPTPLDGVGMWLATLDDPTATPGQQAPNYLYGVSFGFTSSSARGVLGLGTGPAGKTAVLTVIGPSGAPQSVTVPFAWTVGRFYFLFVNQYDAGTWGAAVYDLTANTWTPIGALSLPIGWGKLLPTTVTALFPLGSPPATCAAHPRADVFIHAPTAFVGGVASDQAFVQGGTTDGACASEHAISPGGWIRYRTGTP